MAQQEQRHTIRREDPGTEPLGPPVAVAAQTRTQQVDDLLDEIDSVLEANAETFVQGFVQKGGQ